MSETEDVAALALDIARAAGGLQRERFGDERVIETKSSAIDLVTDVDRASEDLIVGRIGDARPRDGILSEESGNVREAESGWRWVIDPLDGTTNYAHGVPHFAVSIGVEHGGRREVGVIYDPMRDECFTARRGDGARLNGSPTRVSDEQRLDRALLATGFAYDVHEREMIENLEFFSRFIRRARGIRRAGSAALDLAYVACGRFDGFWEMHLSAWDVAAGMLIVTEAGGALSGFGGEPAPADGSKLVASNGALHDALLGVLRA
ncbi:MAG: inositol monophosphatase [Deltaproteobacteria bacterium]|nr:inositol monophosphatase [Deltaproteobacteria bacterium]MBW2415788.1 inositol monophosphatase [Deltaproteobacteria bacterium]